MAIVIIDQFKLGTNLPLDDRYVSYSFNDVSEYWYPGMQVYQTSDNMIYYYNGSTWQPVGSDASIGELMSDISDVSTRVYKTEASIGYLTSYVLNLDSSIQRIDASLSALWTWNINQDSSISNAFSRIQTLDASVSVLKGRVDVIDSSITYINTNISSINSSINRIDGSINKLFANDASLRIYIDGSLAIRDTSLGNLSTWNVVQDASIVRIDGSISYLFLNKADLIGGKVPLNQIPDSVIGGMIFMGTVCPSSGTVDASIKGQYYIVSCDSSAYGYALNTGDWIVFNGLTANPSWGKIDNTDRVTSVNGQIGIVVLGAHDVSAFTMDEIVQNYATYTYVNGSLNTRDGSLGRLDASVNKLFTQISGTDASIIRIDGSLGRLDASVNKLFQLNASTFSNVYNVGAGDASIYAGTVNGNLQLKTLKASSGIIITDASSMVTISMDGSISSVTNIGTGTGIGSKSGSDIRLKTISASTNKIVITSDASNIYIDASINIVTSLSALTDVSIINASLNQILQVTEDGKWHNTNDLIWDTSLATTTDDLGGVPPGTNLKDYTLKEILNKILYEYQVPILTLTSVPVGGILEKGVNITKNTSTYLYWSVANNNYPLAKITYIDFTKTGIGVEGSIGFIPTVNSSNGIFIDASGITNWGGTNRTITYTMRAYDDEGLIQPACASTVDYTYYYRQYYGVVAGTQSLAGLTSPIIKGLAGSIIQGETDLTTTFVNPGTGFIKYLFSYPDTVSSPDNFGALSKIVDQNGFDITSSFDTGTIDVSTDGGNVRYRAYLLTNKVNTPSFTITFRF